MAIYYLWFEGSNNSWFNNFVKNWKKTAKKVLTPAKIFQFLDLNFDFHKVGIFVVLGDTLLHFIMILTGSSTIKCSKFLQMCTYLSVTSCLCLNNFVPIFQQLRAYVPTTSCLYFDKFVPMFRQLFTYIPTTSYLCTDNFVSIFRQFCSGKLI